VCRAESGEGLFPLKFDITGVYQGLDVLGIETVEQM
jgi:hypothetical protein